MANVNYLAIRACGLAGSCLRRVFPETCVFGSCESILVWVWCFELFGGSAIHLFYYFLCSGSLVAPALCACALFVSSVFSSLNAFFLLLFATALFLLCYRICVFAVGPNLKCLVQSALMFFARLLRAVRPSAS